MFSFDTWTGRWVYTDENVGGRKQKQAWDLLGTVVGRTFYSGTHDLEVFQIPGLAQATASSS